MTTLIPAVSLAAALGIGAPPSRLQEPAPSPVVIPVDGANGRVVKAPQPPEPATKAPTLHPPVSSAPGMVAGRADEQPVAAAAEQRRGGGRSGRSTRGRVGGAPRARAPVVVVRRGGVVAPGWWGPSAVYVARPYYYDPFWVSGAFGWSPMFYAPWSLMWTTAGYGPYPWFGSTTFNTGGVRLKVRPRDAQVFVDGFYAGVVDDFDGIFQSLRLAPGGHKIEVRMPGFETLSLDVHIQPDRTMKVEETLRPSNP